MSQDLQTTFCTAQNVFSSSATVQSTDWLDLKVVQDWAAGNEPVVEIVVTTSFSGGNFVQFFLRSCDIAGSTAAGIVLAISDNLTPASLAAPAAPGGSSPNVNVGTVLTLKLSSLNALPAAGQVGMRVEVTCNGAVIAGAISAHLVPESETQRVRKAYGSGF